jgi:hypothetical protein
MLGGRHRRLGRGASGRATPTTSAGATPVARSRPTATGGPTRRARGTRHDERAVLLLLVALDDRRPEPFLLIVVRVVGAVPEVVAVVLVGRPATILFIIIVVGRTAPTAIAKIIDVVVAIGESELVVHLVTARHHRLLWR